MEAFLQGIQYVIQDPILILIIFLGMMIGLVFGSIPGLSGSMAAVLILPFTFSMLPLHAIVLVASMFAASVFGGSTTAILFNIPGDPNSAPTTFDGYPLRKKGKASLALGSAITSSSIGGVFGVLALMLLSAKLARWALVFGPLEYFGLALVGILATASLGAKSKFKGYAASLLGILLSTVGLSMITGIERLSFGSTSLLAGIKFVPVMIGAFAMSEVLAYFWLGAKGHEVEGNVDSKASFVFLEVIQAKWTVVRSALIGVIIGILPGAGATIASFLSYSVQGYFSKKEGKPLGDGELKGVIAPETANNAAAMATLIPLLALGIPGGAVAAIMFGIFQMHGLQPGPLFFVKSAESVYPIYISLFIANLLILPLGIFLASGLAKLIYVPKHILFSIIFVLCTIGAFAVSNNVWDVMVMVLFGFVGLFMKHFGFPIPSMVLGLILGPILEQNLIRAIIAGGNVFDSPIGLTIIIIAITVAILPNLKIFKINNKIG